LSQEDEGHVCLLDDKVGKQGRVMPGGIGCRGG